jgi:AcrR family transcriptional regulator
VSEQAQQAQEAARAPGRPRSAASHQAILGATLELLAEKGMAGMSMDAVAARAGVSKATIYRRWRSKEELVEELLDNLLALVRPIDTGDPRRDFVETGRAAVAAGGPGIKLLPALAGEAVVNPAFGEVFREKLVRPRQAQIRSFLERAVEAGELRADADLDFFADLAFGTVIFRSQIAENRLENLADDQDRVWDVIVENAGTPKGKRALAQRRRESAS